MSKQFDIYYLYVYFECDYAEIITIVCDEKNRT